jgi:uncharacterized protein with PIN domain
MKPWHEDERFLCPDCGHVVELKSVDSIRTDPEEEIYTNNELVAICTQCKRPFLAEQWHLRHGIFDPYWNVDF